MSGGELWSVAVDAHLQVDGRSEDVPGARLAAIRPLVQEVLEGQRGVAIPRVSWVQH